MFVHDFPAHELSGEKGPDDQVKPGDFRKIRHKQGCRHGEGKGFSAPVGDASGEPGENELAEKDGDSEEDGHFQEDEEKVAELQGSGSGQAQEGGKGDQGQDVVGNGRSDDDVSHGAPVDSHGVENDCLNGDGGDGDPQSGEQRLV